MWDGVHFLGNHDWVNGDCDLRLVSKRALPAHEREDIMQSTVDRSEGEGEGWKGIELRYVVAIFAIAIVAFVLTAGGSEVEHRGSTAALPASPPLSREVPRDAVVYIVGGQAEKEALERDDSFSKWFNQPGTIGPTVSMRVIVIKPGQEESLSLLSELVPEAGMTTGNGVKLALFDLR